MTAIRPASMQRFLSAPPPDFFVFLLHGENAGLVTERAADLAPRLVGGERGGSQVTRMDGDVLAGSPGKLADEAYALSMFRERRALRVIAGRKALVPLLEPLLARPPQDFFVVVESAALKRDSPLRRFAEQAPGAAAIECPPDGPAEHFTMIDAAIKSAGISIDKGARDVLAALLPTDRLAAMSEIDKLVLFAASTQDIGTVDVRAVVENGASLVVQDLIDAAFAGKKSTSRLASRLAEPDIDPNALLSSLLWQLTSLHRAKTGAANPEGRPDAYFGRAGSHDASQKLFDAATLLQLIDKLASVIAEVRRFPRLAPALSLRMLLEVSDRASA